MTALNTAPVSVAIAADQRSFQTYSSGIYADPNCGTMVDHAVAVVGYSYTPNGGSNNYWIMRNSWG